jgi:hypothetical protein
MSEHTDFEESGTDLAASLAAPDSENLKFERADWTCFRTVEGLQQKAGVEESKLRRLTLKELADNGLDGGGEARVGELQGGGYFIEDTGPGIDGTPEEIARLFSIARPMTPLVADSAMPSPKPRKRNSSASGSISPRRTCRSRRTAKSRI